MPAFTAIGAYVAGTVFGLVGTAAVVVGALVATGAAYITSRVINGNPNKGNNSAQGSQGGRIQVPPATNNKIPVVYGNSFINGIITDARLITTDQKINDTMFYCIVLSETCNNGSAVYTIDNAYWNDLRLTFDATSPYKVKDGRKNVDNIDGVTEDFIDTNFISDGKHLVEIRVYAGGSASANQIFPTTSTTPAYTFWADNDGSWDSTHEMKGLVYAIVKVTYNGEKGFTGLPNMTFQLNNNISNPADVWYDYMTGVRYGAGIPAADIDTTAQTAWRNFCDEDITYTDKDGATNQSFARYAINGPIDTSRPVKENIDIIMQNAGAWLSYNVATGLWSPIIKKAVTAGELGLPATYFTASRTGSTLTVTTFPAGRIEVGQSLYNSAGTLIGTIDAQLTPTAGETAGQIGRYTTSTSGSISSTTFYTLPAQMLSFTDDNIISGISISSTRLDDLYNSVEAEFYDKHNKDQRAYARNEIDSGDRNPNEPDNQLRLSLDLCNNSMQADLLGQLELRQSRDDLVVEFTTNQYGIQAQAGDVVSITSELYDWAPKYFRVMRVKEQETEEGGLVAQIQALEYNPDVYTVEPITEFTTSANIGIGVYGASPNLPQPPVVEITQIDTNVAIPNFQLQIKIPTTGGPYDEIELYYTEGWDPMSITGSIVPGTGSNGAPVGDGLLTVTAIDYGALNVGDYFNVSGTNFIVTEQLTNNPVSKTYASGGAQFTNTVTLNNTTGLLIGNNLIGTGLPTLGAHITAIAGSQVTLDTSFSVQAAGTYTVFGGLGTYVVDTSATLSGTTTLYDLPVDSDYKYLKKHTPDGNNPTFTNGETVTIVITEVPANTQTYRRWFVKARMGIKKRFGSFSTPTITDLDGNFRYTPSPTGGGSLNNLTDVLITSPNEGQTLYYDADDSKWKNNSILEVDDTATRGGIVVGEGITQPMITFAPQADGVNAMYGIRGKSTLDDPWFVGSGSVGSDQGYLEIAIGDNSGEFAGSNSPIYVRQYNGYAGTGVPWYGGNGVVVNQLTLLDENANTIIPNNLTVDNVLYVDATNNRVGINNSTPNFPLDVGGNVYVAGEYQQTGDNLYLNVDDAGVDVSLYFNSSRTLKWDHSSQRFELNGDTYIQDNLTVAGSSYLGNDYIVDETHVIGEFKVTNNSVDNLFVDRTTGYVGINDNTPSYNLDVNGTANIETTLTVPSITTLTGDNLTITAFSGQDVTISTTAAADPVTIVRNTSTTTTNARALTLRSVSTGTPSAGFGSSLEFEIENASNVVKAAAYVSVDSTNLTAGSETFTMNFGLMDAGAAYSTKMSLDSEGDLQIDGGLTVSGNSISSSTATAITLSGDDVTVVGDLTLTNNTIKSSTATAITLSGDDVTVAGDLTVNGTINFTTFNSIDIGGNLITHGSASQTTVGEFAMFSFNVADYRSAKVQLNLAFPSYYQVVELLVLGSDTDAYLTVTNDIRSDINLAEFRVAYSSGVVTLYSTPQYGTLPLTTEYNWLVTFVENWQ